MYNQKFDNNAEKVKVPATSDIYKEFVFKYILKEICEICLSNKDIVLHHKDKNRNNNTKENIQVLCRRCHTRIHNRGKQMSIYTKNLLSKAHTGKKLTSEHIESMKKKLTGRKRSLESIKKYKLSWTKERRQKQRDIVNKNRKILNEGIKLKVKGVKQPFSKKRREASLIAWAKRKFL